MGPDHYELPRISDNEIESKIKKSHDTGMEKGLNMTLEHFENSNCPKGNCLLCDIKYNIQDNTKKIQEEQDSKLLDKYHNQSQINQNNAYQTGIVHGIKGMNQNPDEDPKNVHNFLISKFKNPVITN